MTDELENLRKERDALKLRCRAIDEIFEAANRAVRPHVPDYDTWPQAINRMAEKIKSLEATICQKNGELENIRVKLAMLDTELKQTQELLRMRTAERDKAVAMLGH